jgi:hypothetical protein
MLLTKQLKGVLKEGALRQISTMKKVHLGKNDQLWLR